MVQNQLTLADYVQQTNERLERIERGQLATKTVLNFEEFCVK